MKVQLKIPERYESCPTAVFSLFFAQLSLKPFPHASGNGVAYANLFSRIYNMKLFANFTKEEWEVMPISENVLPRSIK